MKIRSLALLLMLALLFSCTKNKQAIIAVGTSFWEGKYYINQSYIDAIRENGARVRLIPCTNDKATLLTEIQDVDGFVFIGGRDYLPHFYDEELHESMNVMHEHRAIFDSLFMHLALESNKAILGICAGEQLLNICTGGKLLQDIPNHRGVEHIIWIRKNSHLHDLFGDSLLVNSFHHQCVDPQHLGKNLDITAMASDSIIECIESNNDQWIMGTQFHPERLAKPQRDMIFSMFIKNCLK